MSEYFLNFTINPPMLEIKIPLALTLILTKLQNKSDFFLLIFLLKSCVAIKLVIF